MATRTTKKTSRTQNKILGIDIGGTGIKAAPVDIKKGVLLEDRLRLETPQPPTPRAMLEVIGQLIEHWEWKGKIGCGFPGVLKHGEVHTAANLSKQWVGINLADQINKISSCEAVVINDADSAGLAEMKFGAGKEYNKHGGGVVIMVTLGTGIGTALFVDGHLVHNTELGHIEIDGKDAEKRAAASVRERKKLSWKKWGHRVNTYLQTMEKLLSPDLFIIGGGVSKKPEKFFDFIELKAKIVPAEMHNDAGIVGAALSIEL
ncbi:MAG: polyphosphate glucokinase [Thermodesulfobacteriota bacterium]|nr:MAG: polyphosphate glucokinase [Thermodesulfobacteriota bacterium]